MKIRAINLGIKPPLTISLYTIPTHDNQTHDFFSLDDLGHLLAIINAPNPDQVNSITKLVKADSSSMCIDQHGHIYLKSQLVLILASRLQLYALAELCRLSHKDILAGVGNRLVQSLSTDLKIDSGPHTTEHTLTLDWNMDICLAHLCQLFIEPHIADDGEYPQESVSDGEQTLLECMLPPKTESQAKQKTRNWILRLSKQRNESPRDIQKSLQIATKLRKQQQAIIEARAQQAVMIDTQLGPIRKRQKTMRQRPLKRTLENIIKLSPASISLLSSSASVVCAGTNTPDTGHSSSGQKYRHSLITDPIAVLAPLRSDHNTNSPARVSTPVWSASPLSDRPLSPVLTAHAFDHEWEKDSYMATRREDRPEPQSQQIVPAIQRHEHEACNLDLLATQATKMKVLPTHPVVNLPPFQSVFSELSTRLNHLEQKFISRTTSS
ncbi:hypothetical protein CLU79DRAFT_762308 [Phycomyces nitens]|nr:hypothetical protein CLU79DRAFT_762308 [Phycomyces nitens]